MKKNIYFLKMNQIFQKLDSIYLSNSHPAAFSSANRLYSYAKNIPGVNKNMIRDYLSTKTSFTKHKKRRKRFPRRSIISTELFEIIEADLIDMRSIKNYNDQNQYILILVEVLSGFTYAVSLKNKSANTVLKGFEKIFENIQKIPKYIFSDLGLEFFNKTLIEFLKKNGTSIYHTSNYDVKAAHVENRIKRT
jgi:hypothetical protein